MKKGLFLGWLIFLLSIGNIWAQDAEAILDKARNQTDTALNTPLLLDIKLQIEITNAVNNLYNFKFNEAEGDFLWLQKRYPEHPLSYFLMGLSNWWKIAPDIDNKQYDQVFLGYMDTAIEKAEIAYKKDKNDVEASFFLAAAYSFKGRLYAERSSWRKATFAGKSSLKYFEKCKERDDFSPELLFGDGLYNYFSVWIPENYPLLKPILMFFKKGDKQLGLEQLREVSRNAFYTRTEAQFFLMRILAQEEKETKEALQIAEYLHTTYPDNSYFHRYYARLAYQGGMYVKARPIAEDLMAKVERGEVGYTASAGRYGGFFLGQIYENLKQFDKAKEYYTLSMQYSKEVDALESGYYLYSLINLGEIAIEEDDDDTARSLFKEVKRISKRKHPAWKKADRMLDVLN